MKKSELRQLIKEEIETHFKSNEYCLEDEFIMTNEILLGELLNPDNAYPYIQIGKGIWSYKDMSDVEFIVRLAYQPVEEPYFEFKTGWLDENNKIKYEPSIPSVSKNSTALDWDRRTDTVAKIYRDEIIPFFKQQTLTNTIAIKPISISRMKFAERLVKKFTPSELEIKIEDKDIFIIKQ
jgi:hypothetical protein